METKTLKFFFAPMNDRVSYWGIIKEVEKTYKQTLSRGIYRFIWTFSLVIDETKEAETVERIKAIAEKHNARLTNYF